MTRLQYYNYEYYQEYATVKMLSAVKSLAAVPKNWIAVIVNLALVILHLNFYSYIVNKNEI